MKASSSFPKSLQRFAALLLALNLSGAPAAYAQVSGGGDFGVGDGDATDKPDDPNAGPGIPNDRDDGVGIGEPSDTPGDVSAAEKDGFRDGQGDGGKEGGDRATTDGHDEGRVKGRKRGYDQCFEEEKTRAYDRGYARGHRDGEADGERKGHGEGLHEGRRKGLIDGELDGRTRADRDAYAAATPVGRQRGIDEANQSDAADRGTRDGTASGDRKAKQRAVEVDYKQGREAVRNERFAEPIASNDEIVQRDTRQNDLNSVLRIVDKISDAMHDVNPPSPDRRNWNPRPTHKKDDEKAAYGRGYGRGYLSGFNDVYKNIYKLAYDKAFDHAKAGGCEQAKNEDYRRFHDDGERNGRSRGYDEGYRRAFDIAYRSEYNDAHSAASEDAYRVNYNAMYERHFEAARALAYRERFDAIYSAAHRRAEDAKFNEVYPIYAREEHARGRADEAEDFAQRPVRLLEATVTETINNGLMEPGEALRVRLKLRNFADAGIPADQVKLHLSALTPNGVMIVQPETILAKSLNAKSLTTVREALEFQVSDSLVEQSTSLMLKATYLGRDVGQVRLVIVPKYWLKLEFAEAPELTEGLPAVLKLKVTNQSPSAAINPAQLKMLSDSAKIEIVEANGQAPTLAAGGSITVPFVAIARTSLDRDVIPMAFTATLGTGRRVGLLDFSGQVPIKNDYKIGLTAAAGQLRAAGVTRVNYRLTNVSSRLIFRGLQLKIKISDAQDPANFQILGPNPQLLHPLEKGQSIDFIIPILSRAANPGATLELEVQEDGRETVIHRAGF